MKMSIVLLSLLLTRFCFAKGNVQLNENPNTPSFEAPKKCYPKTVNGVTPAANLICNNISSQSQCEAQEKMGAKQCDWK